MSNKKEIERIFNEESKEIRSWVLYGFFGGHHWRDSNYIQMIGFPLLLLTFLISVFFFSIELVNNIQNISSGGLDVLNIQSGGELISDDLIYSVFPIEMGLIALFSIVLNISWWIYDLKKIENKYLIQKNIYCKIKTKKKPKSLFVTYLLCMFFGTLGVHRFYLEKPISGVYMLFLSLSSFLIITLFILIAWFFYDSLNIYKLVLKENKELYIQNL